MGNLCKAFFAPQYGSLQSVGPAEPIVLIIVQPGDAGSFWPFAHGFSHGLRVAVRGAGFVVELDKMMVVFLNSSTRSTQPEGGTAGQCVSEAEVRL